VSARFPKQNLDTLGSWPELEPTPKPAPLPVGAVCGARRLWISLILGSCYDARLTTF